MTTVFFQILIFQLIQIIMLKWLKYQFTVRVRWNFWSEVWNCCNNYFFTKNTNKYILDYRTVPDIRSITVTVLSKASRTCQRNRVVSGGSMVTVNIYVQHLYRELNLRQHYIQTKVRQQRSCESRHAYSKNSFKIALGTSINHMDSWEGRGVSQMTILLHKPYLVKVTTKGKGVQNTQKIDHVVYGWPLQGSSKFSRQIEAIKTSNLSLIISDDDVYDD